MKTIGFLLVFTHLAAAEPTGALTGKVTVSETNGTRSLDATAVVYVVGFSEPPVKPDVVAAQIEQRDRKFIPDLVAITAGETVQFPNRDPIFHNVFSPTKQRKFDLGTFKGGDSKTKQFSDPGVVDVFCNIHVEMAATVLVVPNRAHVRVAPDGTYRIDGIRPGTWTVFAYARRMTKPASSKVTITAGAATTADFALVRGPEPKHENKYGEEYGGGYK